MAGGGTLRPEEFLPISRDVREIMERFREEEKRPPSFYERLCQFSRRLLGRLVKGMKLTEETLTKLAWAGIRVTPEEWWAGFFLVLGIPVVLGVGGWLVSAPLGASLVSLWYLPVLALALGGLLAAIFYFYPFSLADINKSEAQSRAIETTMLLSFALYHRPDLRGAMIFAANASEGKLAEDLQRGLLELDQKRSYESARHLLTVLAHHWREIDEGTRRAIFDLLRSTGQRDEAIRRQDVARAPRRVLESSEQQLGERLNSLVTPTIAFMTFGSLAIVAVIGLSPLYGMIGLDFIDLKFFALAAAALVAAFLAFTVFIGRKRPVTIPPPRLLPDDPRLPPRGKTGLLGHVLPLWVPSVLVFTVLAAPGVLYLADVRASLGGLVSGLNTFWLLWAITAALAVYAYLYVRPRAKLREEARREMADWDVALNTMGSRIIDGRPMYQAMRETSELMPETIVGEQLKQTSDTMEKMAVDAHYVIFEAGVARKIYNPLIVSLLDVVTRIRRGSEAAAGRACMMAAEFLDTLHGVERRFREKVGDATGDLWLMAIILLPVVCALSVWVMEFMSEMSLTIGAEAASLGLANLPFITAVMESGELALLKLVMGLTAIVLALIVARHIAVIRAGRDRMEFWKTVAPTVLVTTAIFTAAYIGLGLLKVSGG
jgi:hypothetical protein